MYLATQPYLTWVLGLGDPLEGCNTDLEGWETHTYGDTGRWSYPGQTIGPARGELPANNMGNNYTVGVEIWSLFVWRHRPWENWFFFIKKIEPSDCITNFG